MHWTDNFFIAMIIQIAVVIVLVAGIFTIIKSLKIMEHKFRNALLLILSSLTTYVILAVAFSILIYRQTGYESYLWIIPPIIGLIGSYILVLGGRKLFDAINSPEEE